jgi:hypothetical protein
MKGDVEELTLRGTYSDLQFYGYCGEIFIEK